MRVMVFFVGYSMSHLSISSQVATMARIGRAGALIALTIRNSDADATGERRPRQPEPAAVEATA
jgi:hypothetical protein